MDHNETERELIAEQGFTPPLNKPHATFTAEEAEVRKHFNAHMLYLADYAKRMADWYSDDDTDYFGAALEIATALLSADYDGNMDAPVELMKEDGPPWEEATTPEVAKWMRSLGKDA